MEDVITLILPTEVLAGSLLLVNAKHVTHPFFHHVTGVCNDFGKATTTICSVAQRDWFYGSERGVAWTHDTVRVSVM
jgi:hypothetical protein